MRTSSQLSRIWFLLIFSETLIAESGHSRDLMVAVSSDLYEYCPITNFQDRQTNATGLPEEVFIEMFKVKPWLFQPCCSACSSESDCGYRKPCCPDTEFFEDVQSTCKYPAHVGYPESKLRSQMTAFDKPAISEPALWMVQKCLTKYAGTDLESKCINTRLGDVDEPMGVSPVLDTLTRTVYSNIFCAMCNDIDRTIDDTFFKPVFTCLAENMASSIFSTKGEREALLRNYTCIYQFRPRDPSVVSDSVCVPFDSRSNLCNTTGQWSTYDKYIEDACNAYTLPYIPNAVGVYKNVHCYICNVQSPEFSAMCIVNHEFFMTLSFYAVLHVEGGGQTTSNGHLPCPLMMFYDPYKNRCRNTTCPITKTETQNGCQNMYSSFAELYFDFTILWIQVGESTTNEMPNIDLVAEQAITDLRKNLIYKFPQIYNQACGISVFVNQDKNGGLLVGTYFSWRSWDGETLLSESTLDFINKHKGDGRQVKVDINGTTLYFQAVLVNKPVMKSTGSYIRTEYMSFDGRELSAVFFYKNNSHLDFTCTNSITAARTLICDLVLLSKYEYNELENGYISIAANNLRLYETDYVKHELTGAVSVCIDDYIYGSVPQMKTSSIFEDVAVYSSFVCSICSITGLLFTLFTFCLFKSLRSVPGKINICLCGSLLVAQTLQLFFMDQTQYETMCVIFGALVHFSWLNVVAWMNVCSFNLFRTFSNFRIRFADFVEKHLLVLYFAYAFFIPFIFVAINILLAVVESGMKDIGYGGSVCYISSPSRIVYTFTVPLETLICTNIIFLVVSILGITKVSIPSENASNDRNTVVIFLKLSTLTGGCWLFGLLRMWTGHVVFEYLFIFANATQGLFIMLSFVCNRRVLHLYQNKLQTIPKQHVRTTSTTGTT